MGNQRFIRNKIELLSNAINLFFVLLRSIWLNEFFSKLLLFNIILTLSKLGFFLLGGNY